MPSINLLPGAGEEKKKLESKPPVRRVEFSSPSKESADQNGGPGGLFSFFRRRTKEVPSLTEQQAPKPVEEPTTFQRGTGIGGNRTVVFGPTMPPLKTFSALPEKKGERTRGEIVEMRTVERRGERTSGAFSRFFRFSPKPVTTRGPSMPSGTVSSPPAPSSIPDKAGLSWWKKAFRSSASGRAGVARPVTLPTLPPPPQVSGLAPGTAVPQSSFRSAEPSAPSVAPLEPPMSVDSNLKLAPPPPAPLPELEELSSPRLDVNLMPTEFQEAAVPRTKLLILGAVVMTAILLVVGASAGLSVYKSKKVDELTKLSERIANLDQAIASFAAFQKDALALKDKIDVVETLLSKHIRWTAVLNWLEQTTHPSVYYSGFTGDVGGKVSLAAAAKDFSSLSSQYLAFQRDTSVVKEVNITGATVVHPALQPAGGAVQPSTSLTGGVTVEIPPNRVEFSLFLTLQPETFVFDGPLRSARK